MTLIHFEKYQATGNDFIMIDNRDGQYDLTTNQITHLCDRKFGIGSDGLILIQSHADYDFEMIFYNPDSSQSLCGNGSRCAVNFAKTLGVIIHRKTTFLAFDGPHEAEILADGAVKLKMSEVQNVINLADGMFIDTGSPHLVKYVPNVDEYPVYEEGKVLRNHGPVPDGSVNVNFVEVIDKDVIKVRTYERGVENETLSCGTGVTASALAAYSKGLSSPVKVNTRGGTLNVAFKEQAPNQFINIYLTGPAISVFKGEIEIHN